MCTAVGPLTGMGPTRAHLAESGGWRRRRSSRARGSARAIALSWALSYQISDPRGSRCLDHRKRCGIRAARGCTPGSRGLMGEVPLVRVRLISTFVCSFANSLLVLWRDSAGVCVPRIVIVDKRRVLSVGTSLVRTYVRTCADAARSELHLLQSR